jgi:ketosteroid isomerase-like protein
MSDLQKNKDLVRAILKHIGDFNIQEIGKLVTDDVIWWVNGGGQDGQYFYGKEASLKLIGVVGDNLVDSKIRLEILGMIAEGDRVAVEVRSYGTMKNGNEYRNSYHEIYEIRDGLVALCKEYADTKYSADVGIRPRGPQNDISASIHRPGLG